MSAFRIQGLAGSLEYLSYSKHAYGHAYGALVCQALTRTTTITGTYTGEIKTLEIFTLEPSLALAA